MTTIKGPDPYAVAEAQLRGLFTSPHVPRDVYARVSVILHATIPTYTWVGIALLAGSRLVLRAWQGAALPAPLPTVLTAGVSAIAATQGELAVVDDVLADPHYHATVAGTRAEIAVPIRERSRVYGVLIVASEHRGAFGLADRALLQAVAAELGRCAAGAAP